MPPIYALEEFGLDDLLVVSGLFPAIAPHLEDEQAMLERAAEYLGAACGDTCVIRLLDDDHQGPFGVWASEPARASVVRQALERSALSRTESLAGAVLTSGRPLVIKDVQAEDLRARLPAAFHPYVEQMNVGSLAVYPLEAPAAPIGYVAVSRAAGQPRLDDRAIAVLEALVPRVSVLLANARLVSAVRAELAAKEHALQELEASETRFRTIVEQGFDVISVIAEDGRLLYASPSVQRVFGYEPDEVLGTNPLSFVHPDDVAHLIALGDTVRSGGSVPQSVYRVRARDGRWVSVEATAGGQVDIGGTRGIVMASRDVSDRIAAEQESRFLAGIVHSSDDAILSLDENGAITSWNPAAERLFGYRSDEALGRPFGDLVPASRVEETREAIALLRRGETVRQLQTVRKTKDGEEIPLSLTAWPMYRTDGEYSGAAAIVRDMRERLDAERRLRRSEEFFRAVFENAPMGIAVLDPDGRLIRANSTLAAAANRSPSDLIGIEWINAVHAGDRDAVRKALSRAISGSTPVRVRQRLHGRGGRLIETETTITAVEGRGDMAPRLVAHIDDVTARRRAEADLRRRAQQQACVAQIGAAALADSDVTSLAATAAELTAATLAPATVRVVPLGDATVLRPVTAGTGVVASAASPLRVNINAPNRTIGFLEVELPETTPADEVLVFIEAVASMLGAAAERRELGEQLSTAQRVQDIGSLAGSVAHDFNNLLTIILGAGDLIRGRLRDEESEEAVERILDAGGRAAGLVRQLMAFAKERSLAKVTTDVPGLVRQLEPVLRTLAGDSRLYLDLQAWALFVAVERTNLEQIIVNLVVNARDALAGAGDIVLAVALERRAGRDGVLLTVADNGPGMSGDVAARCFTPFFTTKGAGTGLGLPTVHRIVTMNGGEADVTTAPGKGATFRVWLPREEPTSGAHRAEATASDDSGSELVLVAEDESHVRDLLVHSLSAAGYAVVVAEDGAHAATLAGALESPPDILVTDVVMPGMTGIELANGLRKRWPSLPVLFITGHAPAAVDVAPDVPGSALLRKPFRPSEFVRAVRDQLDAARH